MTKKPVPSLASVPVTAPAEPAVPTAPVAAPAAPPPAAPAAPTAPRRESLHVRVSVETVERVREAAHRLRRDKQDIAEEALCDWLAARGL